MPKWTIMQGEMVNSAGNLQFDINYGGKLAITPAILQ
jgi:hypothetical protein